MKLTSALLGLFIAGFFASAHGQTVNFAFGVTNDGTSVQQYTYTLPTTPLSVDLPAGLYNVSGTFGITLTAAMCQTATFSLPNEATSYMQGLINGQPANINIGTATETTTDGTEVFSFPSESSQFLLTSTGTTMSVTTTFDLSPGDSASFSGSFRVTATPEPTSLGLALIATGAFAFLIICSRCLRALATYRALRRIPSFGSGVRPPLGRPPIAGLGSA